MSMQTKLSYLINITLNIFTFADIEITLKIVLVVVQIVGGALIILNQINQKKDE